MSHLNNDQIKPAFNRNEVALWLLEYGCRFSHWTDCNIHLGKMGHIGVIPGLVVKSDDLSGNGEKLNAILDTLEVWNITEGRSLYIAPNPMKGDTRGKDHVHTYAANWVDIDCGIDRVGEALEIIKALPVAPSLVLMSGNGLQLQYLTEHRDYGSWLSVQEGLFARFSDINNDTSRMKDSSSWMKMPGTVAYKPTYNADGWRATVTYRLDTEAKTDGQKLVKSFPSAPKKERSGLVNVVEAPTQWKNDPKTVAPKGRRPAALSEIGFQWNHVDGNGDALRGLMREWFEAIPDSAKDAPGGDGEPFEWDEVADIVKDFIDDKVSERWRRNATPYERAPTFDPDDDSPGLGYTMLGEMVDKVVPKQYGLVKGLYRKMIGMIYSPDGLGKTVATLYGVFCQIVGREFSDFTEEHPAGLGPVRVLYVECEDGQEEAIDRLQKMLGGTYRRTLADGTEETYSYSMGDFDQYERAIIRKNFAVISEARLLGADGKTAESLDLSNPRHMFALRRAVRAGRFDLVIIDVMKQAFPKVDENNNTDVQVKIIDPLKVMVQDENIGALVIHHANGQGNARGATSFKGATRYRRKLSVLMEPDPDNPELKIPRLDGAFRWNLEKDKRSLKKKLEYLRIDSREDGSLAVVIEDPSNIRIAPPRAGEAHAQRAYEFLKSSGSTLGAREIKSSAGLTDRNWKDALPLLRNMPGVVVETVNGNEAYRLNADFLFLPSGEVPGIKPSSTAH